MSLLKHSRSLLVVSNSSCNVYSSRKKLKYELFIGNLKPELSTKSLIEEMRDFFTQVDVHVPDFRFTIFQRRSKNRPPFKYAFVTVTNETEEQRLFELHGTENLRFVIKDNHIIIQKRINYRQAPSSNVKLLFNGAINTLKESKSVPGISITTGSLENMGNLVYKKELFLGQFLPAEDRVTEYKRGSGKYMKNMLINHVRKYICAFLNSKGGRLMIGVDDNCKVYGVSCTRKQEDQARCLIDNTVKNFQPHVSPNLYIIDFIPVKISPYDQIDIDSADSLLKVVEISVQRPNGDAVLYSNDRGDIYVRRDGSVEGPLKTTQIVEWCRNIFSSKKESKDHIKTENTSCNIKNSVTLAKDNCYNEVSFQKLESHLMTIISKLEDQIIQQSDDYARRESFYIREIEYARREAAYYKNLVLKSECHSDRYICNIV